MFSPVKTGRLKTRLRQAEKNTEAATLLPELKQFLNELPFKDRVRVAWRIIIGRF